MLIIQETGEDIVDSELTTAFQFGKEATIQNVLEPNWWDSERQEGEEDGARNEVERLSNGQPKLVAKTRVLVSNLPLTTVAILRRGD